MDKLQELNAVYVQMLELDQNTVFQSLVFGIVLSPSHSLGILVLVISL